MSTRSDENETSNPDFDNILGFDSEEDEIAHESRMIMFRFLSEIEILLSSKGIRKKDLARMVNTSPSYITQLFKGDKLLNLTMLAKIQKSLQVVFDIKAKKTEEYYIFQRNPNVNSSEKYRIEIPKKSTLTVTHKIDTYDYKPANTYERKQKIQS